MVTPVTNPDGLRFPLPFVLHRLSFVPSPSHVLFGQGVKGASAPAPAPAHQPSAFGNASARFFDFFMDCQQRVKLLTTAKFKMRKKIRLPFSIQGILIRRHKLKACWKSYQQILKQQFERENISIIRYEYRKAGMIFFFIDLPFKMMPECLVISNTAFRSFRLDRPKIIALG